MPLKFDPHYTISPKMARQLVDIEAIAKEVERLPIDARVLAGLRESARLQSTHYSTQIEGNRLTQEEVEEVVKQEHHLPGKGRDEGEVKGYYAALEYLEQAETRGDLVSERWIQRAHALVMGKGSKRVRPTSYRDGQNVIRDAGTRSIVYLPPEAKDVAPLMGALVEWVKQELRVIPCPLVAAIAHYQFATIHPYYDGNGRCARLLTTYILHANGYGLRGLYSLEEYYASNLTAYYEALAVGPSHNYYMGRSEADITSFIAYFIEGVVTSFQAVKRQAASVAGGKDFSLLLRQLDPKMRKALILFQAHRNITSHEVGQLFGFAPRTASGLCKQWVEVGFIEVIDPSKKGRRYALSAQYQPLITIRD